MSVCARARACAHSQATRPPTSTHGTLAPSGSSVESSGGWRARARWLGRTVAGGDPGLALHADVPVPPHVCKQRTAVSKCIRGFGVYSALICGNHCGLRGGGSLSRGLPWAGRPCRLLSRSDSSQSGSRPAPPPRGTRDQASVCVAAGPGPWRRLSTWVWVSPLAQRGS